MTGHTKFSEIRRGKGDPRWEARAREFRAEMEREELTLAELRRARALTQAQLAEALDTTQSAVSRLEKQTDLYLSTLRSYVEAMGGTLKVEAVFPNGGVTILAFRSLDEVTERQGAAAG